MEGQETPSVIVEFQSHAERCMCRHGGKRGGLLGGVQLLRGKKQKKKGRGGSDSATGGGSRGSVPVCDEHLIREGKEGVSREGKRGVN